MLLCGDARLAQDRQDRLILFAPRSVLMARDPGGARDGQIAHKPSRRLSLHSCGALQLCHVRPAFWSVVAFFTIFASRAFPRRTGSQISGSQISAGENLPEHELARAGCDATASSLGLSPAGVDVFTIVRGLLYLDTPGALLSARASKR
jgi:hypothetical protein